MHAALSNQHAFQTRTGDVRPVPGECGAEPDRSDVRTERGAACFVAPCFPRRSFAVSFIFSLREIIALEKSPEAPPKAFIPPAAPPAEPVRETAPPRIQYRQEEEPAPERVRRTEKPPRAKEPEAEEADTREKMPLRRTIWTLGTVAVVLLGIAVFMYMLLPGGPSKGPGSGGTAGNTATATPAPTPTTTVNTSTPEPTPTPTPATEAVPGQIPNLIGMTQEAAEQAVKAAGMRYSYFIEPNPAESGTVFRQEPAPNQPANKGDRVTFYISKG